MVGESDAKAYLTACGLEHTGLSPERLVIEHAFLADAELRACAIELGITSWLTWLRFLPDPITCPAEEQFSLKPSFPLVGGRVM
jgi:hypothetical protein